MKKVFKNVSDVLGKGQRFIDRHLVDPNPVSPKKLKYSINKELPLVVHFNANFVIGGTSQLIADLFERSSDRYYHKLIVPSYPRPLPYQPVDIVEHPVTDMNSVYQFLKKEKPVLVHIHYWIRPVHRYYSFGLWYDAIFKICEELGIPVVQNINVPTHPFQSRSIIHNVFVSEFVRKEYNDQQQVSHSVIYPGSDLGHFSCPDDFDFPSDTVGMVYRLDQDKLDETAIEIFIAAAKKNSRLICYIIGGGYYLEYYKKRVAEEKLDSGFVFTGFVTYDQLPSYYKKLGLVVAPVHDESFGQVTPFAMSMGLPVTGYNTGAMAEILGSTEWLKSYGDVEGVADYITQLMSDPQKRKEEGLKNKQRAKSYFSVEKMIDEYDRLYQQYI